jgi:hypothetical protein
MREVWNGEGHEHIPENAAARDLPPRSQREKNSGSRVLGIQCVRDLAIEVARLGSLKIASRIKPRQCGCIGCHISWPEVQGMRSVQPNPTIGLAPRQYVNFEACVWGIAYCASESPFDVRLSSSWLLKYHRHNASMSSHKL